MGRAGGRLRGRGGVQEGGEQAALQLHQHYCSLSEARSGPTTQQHQEHKQFTGGGAEDSSPIVKSQRSGETDRQES